MHPYPLLPPLFRDVLVNLHLLFVFKRGISSEVNERPVEYESLVLCEPSKVADLTPLDLLAA